MRNGPRLWWEEAHKVVVRMNYRLNTIRDPVDFVEESKEDLDWLLIKLPKTVRDEQRNHNINKWTGGIK